MGNSLNVLLIEDDEIEVMKLNRVVKSLEQDHTIIEARDGEKALQILEQKENPPDIILLDLNMPKINGIEFLGLLKKDPVLKYIPTIILTTSNNQNDLLACYNIGIAGYILKPLKYEEYIRKIELVLAYWSVNELKKS